MSDKHKSKPSTMASKIMFDMANIQYEQYTPKKTKIVIDFQGIDLNKTEDNPA